MSLPTSSPNLSLPNILQRNPYSSITIHTRTLLPSLATDLRYLHAIWIANAGDSVAVLARKKKKFIDALKAVRISEEHNASFEFVREELRSLHPNDPNLKVLRCDVWRVRGLIQVICAVELMFYAYTNDLFVNIYMYPTSSPMFMPLFLAISTVKQ
ncbi:hypothetical protein L1987_85089 [Smallanthus sonchifolius]|uniref:Uncharacterized protein n=1 Tax=Smallanthus sonchifolius TaxID=185202 RepID=A0ACB8XX60_9ASTR|nr:hypothetical protein L1987_85089 [Smallanthus sonchifolius]